MRKTVKVRLIDLVKQQPPYHCLLGRLSSEFLNLSEGEHQLIMSAISAGQVAAAQRMEGILNETPETPEVAKITDILEIMSMSRVPIVHPLFRFPAGVLSPEAT